ncbi:MAG: HlyC/CorC family transporter [Acidimicrobiales bacterium]|nr:HlyC/CorC family transporter [Acidimicrobiales bacterium]RZV45410.1 MAG: HlyC/CorC family transporter [Acidimicrobiales bacterium]
MSASVLAVNVVTGVVLPVVIVLALVVINGVFVAAEFALVGSRRSRIAALAEDGNRGARWLLKIFDRPTGKDSYIAVAQLGITLASIGLGMYGEPAIAHWLYDPFESLGLSEGAAHTVGFLVALSIITYLHVVFGEMIPKALALSTPEGTSLKVNPVMRTFSALFRPAVAVLNWIALSLMRLLRIPEPDKTLSLYSSEELAIVTDESADVGELPELQREIIHNILELEDLTAEELMTSRSHVLAMEHDATRADITARIHASTTSRYPVFVDHLDHVIGILHVKDFVRVSQSEDPIDLTTLVRQLPTVGGNTAADVLLERFKNERVHAALVVDELGSTIGLVTLDDIISEVLDDPAGDHDLPAVVHDDGSVTLDGETTLTELLEDHGLTFEHNSVTTLAGLVLSQTGTVPGVGDAVEVQGHELTVEGIDGYKLTQIRVDRLDVPDREPESGDSSAGH